MATRYKKGDKVVVISGKDSGKEGTILDVNTEKCRITIEGINIIKRHLKASKEKDGGIVESPAPIHWSKAKIIDPSSNKPTSIGFETVDGKKRRKAKVSGELF
ncbi:MAG: 50S ribosomal protein L24 [bacterium]|nr:50S ribosomal protein L24 [bacterium]